MDTPSPGSAAAAHDFGALAPDQLVGAGRYRLKKILGQGGMSVVWLAHDQRLREPVALKFLPASIAFDPAALDDLRRETYRSRKLSHPHIVRIHDLHEDPGTPPFITMEYVDGPNLHFLRAHRPAKVLPWKFLAPLVRQLAQALDYAHAEKIVHRDLKPANLLLDSSERLKLADFGLARVMRDSMSRLSGATNPGGTLHFMSPQQADGCKAQASDDVYSLGASLYDLLTSTPPFYTGDVAYQVRHTRPIDMLERLMEVELVNEIPPAVSEFVMACLAKDPAQRPASATVLLECLDAIERGAVTLAMPGLAPAPEAPPAPPPPPPPSPSPVAAPAPMPEVKPEALPPAEEAPEVSAPARRWWPMAGILALALAAGGIAWQQWQTKPSTAAVPPQASTNQVAKSNPTNIVADAGNSSGSAALATNELIQPPPNTALVAPPAGASGHWETLPPLAIGRVRATAVWTGREMIVWGGGTEGNYFNSGFALEPAASRWRPVSLVNAPTSRASHAGVWTGKEMLIWGGRATWDPVNHRRDGGRYDPARNVWRPMKVSGAPTPRSFLAYAWNGEEMLVWGGQGDGDVFFTDGGRYHPGTDTWKPIPAAGGPGLRMEPSFVWAGFGFVIWGGNEPGPSQAPLNTGCIYVPARNQWQPMSNVGAPSPRRYATAVWTGREVIFWGGSPIGPGDRAVFQDGACYNPFTDKWTPMNTAGAPEGRFGPSAVWTGTEMLVWGGMGQNRRVLNSGGRYNPRTNTWTPMETGMRRRRASARAPSGPARACWSTAASPAASPR